MSRTLAILAVAATTAGTSAAVLVPAGADSPAPPGERIVRLVEHQGKDHLVDAPPRGGRMGVGDGAIVTKSLFDTAGARVGALHLVCTQVTGGRDPYVTCTGIADLKGGTLTVANGFRFSDTVHLASVTGGTGAYAGARGWLEGKTAPGGDDSVNNDVIHLLP